MIKRVLRYPWESVLETDLTKGNSDLNILKYSFVATELLEKLVQVHKISLGKRKEALLPTWGRWILLIWLN